MKYQRIHKKINKTIEWKWYIWGADRVVIEWKKGKEGEWQEGGTEESDKGREIIYGPGESIKECKTGDKGQNGDGEKRAEKWGGGRGRGTGQTGRMTWENRRGTGERWRRKAYPMSAFHVNNFGKVHNVDTQ